MISRGVHNSSGKTRRFSLAMGTVDGRPGLGTVLPVLMRVARWSRSVAVNGYGTCEDPSLAAAVLLPTWPVQPRPQDRCAPGALFTRNDTLRDIRRAQRGALWNGALDAAVGLLAAMSPSRLPGRQGPGLGTIA